MKGKLVFLSISFLVLGAGCSPSQDIDNASGIFENLKEQVLSLFEATVPSFINDAGTNYIRNLTDNQKGAIDAWLDQNDLNQFGDPLDTLYTGGSPLFNEVTGESVDRFKYLYEKFPNLKDIVQQQLDAQLDAMQK